MSATPRAKPACDCGDPGWQVSVQKQPKKALESRFGWSRSRQRMPKSEKDVTMRKLFCLVPFTLSVAFQAQAQSLPEAIQQALQAHPQVQADISGRRAADFQLKAAKGGYLPSIDVFAGYGREGTDDPSTRVLRDDHWTSLTRGESSVRLQQMLFDGFATSSEVARQQAGVDARAFGLLATTERTALDAVQVYLDVLRREELVRLAEENLKSHQRMFDQIHLRSARGVGSTADSDQAEQPSLPLPARPATAAESTRRKAA